VACDGRVSQQQMASRIWAYVIEMRAAD
jgi:hypothetical protein